MDEYTAKDRMSEGQNYLKKYALDMKILLGAVFIIVMISIGPSLLPNPEGYGTNVYTELASVLATIVVIDSLNEKRLIKSERARLIREAGSTSNETAKAAISEMQKRELIGAEYHLLRNSDLRYANLENALLRKADLVGVDLSNSILSGANCSYSNFAKAKMISVRAVGCRLEGGDLSNVNIVGSNFSRADFSRSDCQGIICTDSYFSGACFDKINADHSDFLSCGFQGARIRQANFKNVILSKSDLCDAIVFSTDFSGANLKGVRFNSETQFMRGYEDSWNWRDIPTILPDGTEVRSWRDYDPQYLVDTFGMIYVEEEKEGAK